MYPVSPGAYRAKDARSDAVALDALSRKPTESSLIVKAMRALQLLATSSTFSLSSGACQARRATRAVTPAVRRSQPDRRAASRVGCSMRPSSTESGASTDAVARSKPWLRGPSLETTKSSSRGTQRGADLLLVAVVGGRVDEALLRHVQPPYVGNDANCEHPANASGEAVSAPE